LQIKNWILLFIIFFGCTNVKNNFTDSLASSAKPTL